MIVRREGKPIRRLILLGICILCTLVHSVEAQDQCTLCADGSDPDMTLSSDELGWNCWDLNTFASILKEGETECTELQIVGFQDCACPTYPSGFCTLCPGGFSDIPDRSVSVPSTNNLTCGDILFVEASLLQGGCDDLAPYRERCGCPVQAECQFCADGSMPAFTDRVLPYLNTPFSQTTCGQQAQNAFSATPGQCGMYTVAPVAVNPQGYCGCQGTFPSDLCTLCPDGQAVTNPTLVVPETDGMTCLQMEEYLRYITDEDSCQTIATRSASVCCEVIEPCPVCPDGPDVEYSRDKIYPPYDLTCENIGTAEAYGWPMTCDDVKMRFPYYCDCPGAVPACTLCQLGELPPESDKEIPLLGTTCEEVNDFASIRLSSECAAEKARQSFAASAYCGCTGFEAPQICTFCPEDEFVRDIALVPVGSDGATCGELADFADYVIQSSLCSSVQAYASQCCVNPSDPTEAPSTGPPSPPTTAPLPGTPTLRPTPSPTLLPTTITTSPPTQRPSSSRRSSLFFPIALIVLGMMVQQGL